MSWQSVLLNIAEIAIPLGEAEANIYVKSSSGQTQLAAQSALANDILAALAQQSAAMQTAATAPTPAAPAQAPAVPAAPAVATTTTTTTVAQPVANTGTAPEPETAKAKIPVHERFGDGIKEIFTGKT
jgi:hypothetical protein